MKGGGNKYLWYGVAIVAIIVLIAALRQDGTSLYEGDETSPTPTAGASVTPGSAVGKTPTPTSGSTLTYEEAVVQYASRRFQFDQYCQANPRSLSIPNGTSIMLDNRSGDARTFAVGGVFYTIGGYGWKIVTPTAKNLPATLYLDCGSARNVGTVLLQP